MQDDMRACLDVRMVQGAMGHTKGSAAFDAEKLCLLRSSSRFRQGIRSIKCDF